MEITLFEDEKEISNLRQDETKLVLTNRRLVKNVDKGIMFQGLLSIGLESLDSISRGWQRSGGLLVLGFICAVIGIYFFDSFFGLGKLLLAIGVIMLLVFWFYKEHSISFKTTREEINFGINGLSEDKINGFVDDVMKAKVELVKK